MSIGYEFAGNTEEPGRLAGECFDPGIREAPACQLEFGQGDLGAVVADEADSLLRYATCVRVAERAAIERAISDPDVINPSSRRRSPGRHNPA